MIWVPPRQDTPALHLTGGQSGSGVGPGVRAHWRRAPQHFRVIAVLHFSHRGAAL
jgi:hypothetical protein